MIELLQLSAALYLASGILAVVSSALVLPRAARAALVLLAIGAALQAISFALLHQRIPTPSLTEMPVAISLMTWMATVFFLAFARRAQLSGLVTMVAPVAFLGAFYAALRIPRTVNVGESAAGSLPHAHVLLASAGFALLAVAAIAGAVFLVEDRRLKHKRVPRGGRLRIPSLEALDRVNAVSLAAGFCFLTLGVVTGMLWLENESGHVYTGSAHETWTLIAWGIYALLVVARFVARRGPRNVAASAVAGFVFLVFAVVGVELFS